MGYRVIPIPFGQKAPDGLRRWEAARIDDADLPAYFSTVPDSSNIGVLLGEPSQWLVDVDLDCEEACNLAGRMLPPTGLVTGRASRPGSHWWYVASGAVTRRFSDPVTKGAIIELRSTGAQTVVGPSRHPEGERYESLIGEPATVDAADLLAAVEAVHAEVCRLRHGAAPVARPAERAPVAIEAPRANTDVERRAVKYLDSMPPAISGQGGHNAAYAAAVAVVHGFGIDPDRALSLLLAAYNPRCSPPWTEAELRHKVKDAAAKPHERPLGWIRDQRPSERPASPAIDLAGFTVKGRPAFPVERPQGPRESKSGANGKAGASGHGGPENVASEAGEGEDRAESVEEGAPRKRRKDAIPRAPAWQRIPDPGRLPAEYLDVPGFVGEVMAFNLATAPRQQPVLALAAAITLQAVLCARKVRDERGNRTNLYCVGIADSGLGKDYARKVNKNILFAAGLSDHEGNEDLASDSGLVSAIESQPAILFQIDEFGRFLRTLANPQKAPHLYNVITALMKLYSCADTTFRGKAYSDRQKNKVVHQPCASVYGTTVPSNFFESLTTESIADGFVARLLVFEAPQEPPPRRREPQAEIPEHLIKAARWWGDFKPGGNLAAVHPQPRIVPTLPEACEVFDALAAVVDVQLGIEGDPGKPIWSRAEEKACRLALIYACSVDPEHPRIDYAAARWACGLAEHLSRRVIYLCQEWVSEGLFDARQKRVLRAIRDAGGRISKRDLTRRTQWLTIRDRSEIVDNLIESGDLEARLEDTEGRSRMDYVIPSGE